MLRKVEIIFKNSRWKSSKQWRILCNVDGNWDWVDFHFVLHFSAFSIVCDFCSYENYRLLENTVYTFLCSVLLLVPINSDMQLLLPSAFPVPTGSVACAQQQLLWNSWQSWRLMLNTNGCLVSISIYRGPHLRCYKERGSYTIWTSCLIFKTILHAYVLCVYILVGLINTPCLEKDYIAALTNEMRPHTLAALIL